MLNIAIAHKPYIGLNPRYINFTGKSSKGKKHSQSEKNVNSEGPEAGIPRVLVRTPKKDRPSPLNGVSFLMRKLITEAANLKGISIDEELRSVYRVVPKAPNVIPVASSSAIVGNTRVHTLIDGEQIFSKTLEYIKSAEKSIQIEMFEFQNLTVDGKTWAQNGAQGIPGAKEQQQILELLIKKKRANPNIKIQVILDAHKWYINGYSRKLKHYGNQHMIRFLKENGIDVVPYPRASQEGTVLQHVKLLIIDGKKAILGGMNWGSHSAANHDACVAIETLPGKSNSEVDNIIDTHFNADWTFAWKRIGEKEIVQGPLSEQEQPFYSGLSKEIKPENVEYKRLVGEFYSTPEAQNRYREGQLDLISANPVSDPKIGVLGTKPREYEEIGKKGLESTREEILKRVRACKKVVGELFVISDSELVEVIISRFKAKELDARFIISSDIIEQFPYCRRFYDKLITNGVPVSLYKADKETRQRLHCKWAVFDDQTIVIGSTNWSSQGMNQNLSTGIRGDYEITSSIIDEQIEDFVTQVSERENDLGIKPLEWDGSDEAYKKLKTRRKTLKRIINDLAKGKSVTANIAGQVHSFSPENISTLQVIRGYYKNIQVRHNAKAKFKRGNNELAVVFDSKVLAQTFIKQFKRDWAYSRSEYDILKRRVFRSLG